MELTKQVTSLELSKRLKELGVKQESLFYWINTGELPYEDYMVTDTDNAHDTHGGTESWVDDEATISAFTVAELGEMLPNRLEGNHPLWYLTVHCNDNYYAVTYETFNGVISEQFDARDKNEANARAKMLIYLLENELLKVLK